MTEKKRKALEDTLASQFVFGSEMPGEAPASMASRLSAPPAGHDGSSALPDSPPVLEPATEPEELKMQTRFQMPEKEPTVRLTVDLAASMHRKLSMLAAQTGRKKVDIVRVLLEDALKGISQ
jgi:hypothetical protein